MDDPQFPLSHEQSEIIASEVIGFLEQPGIGESLDLFGFCMTWKAPGVIELTKPGGIVEIWEFTGLESV